MPGKGKKRVRQEDEEMNAGLLTEKQAKSMNADLEEDEAVPVVQHAWRPGVDELGENETLEHDPTAYYSYHKMHWDWPCLSFDILADGLGDSRGDFPYEMYMVAGTQADEAKNNHIKVLNVSNVQRTYKAPRKQKEGGDNDEDDDSDFSEGSDDEDEEGRGRKEPRVAHTYIKHYGSVNRIRAMPQKGMSHIVATWSENSNVYVHDIKAQLEWVTEKSRRDRENVTSSNDQQRKRPNAKVDPLHTVSGHPNEGFALAWSGLEEGKLLSGNSATTQEGEDAYIYLSQIAESHMSTDMVPFSGHTCSVEDIALSPVQGTVFASCSADKTVRIWDTRDKKKKCQLQVVAHEADVNVLSWNPNDPGVLATGGDDGLVKTWDLRNLRASEFTAQLVWHRNYISSLEWHPTDVSMLAASGADDCISIWDLSLEPDVQRAPQGALLAEGDEVPSQLLFLHQGQTNIKEVHWHKQIPGLCVSTAQSGLNVFHPANIGFIGKDAPQQDNDEHKQQQYAQQQQQQQQQSSSSSSSSSSNMMDV
jgi:ribosome assembly protein RRB1